MTFQWCFKLQVVGDKKWNHVRWFYVHFFSLAQLPMHCCKTLLLFPINASALQGMYPSPYSIHLPKFKQASSFYIIFAPFPIFNSSFHPPFFPFAKNHSQKKKTPSSPQEPPPESIARPVESFGPIAAPAPGNWCFGAGVSPIISAKNAWLPMLFWGLMPGIRFFFPYHFLGAPQRWWAPTPQQWWCAYSRDSLELCRGLGGRN